MNKDGDNVLNFEKAMSQFSAMFPDLDNQLIESVLRTNDGNVEETIEKLLELSCTTASTSEIDKVSKNNEIKNEPSRAEHGQPSSRDPCADDEKIALLIQNREFLSYLRHDPNFQKAIIGRHQASAKNAHHYPLPHGPPVLLSSSKSLLSPNNHLFNRKGGREWGSNYPDRSTTTIKKVEELKPAIPEGPLIEYLNAGESKWSEKIKSKLAKKAPDGSEQLPESPLVSYSDEQMQKGIQGILTRGGHKLIESLARKFNNNTNYK